MNIILEYVNSSDTINKAMDRFIPSNDRREFKQFIIMELVKMDQDKLFDSYKGGYLDLLVYRVMKNQYVSKNSYWFKQNNTSDVNIDDISDIPYCDDDNTDKERIEMMTKDILIILNNRKYGKNGFLKKQYHETLFNLHFFEGKNYSEIERVTGVNYQSVRNSILGTLEYIKQNINNDKYNN